MQKEYKGRSAASLADGADVRVMSYNVLVDNDEQNGGWRWGAPLADRGDKASAAIGYYRPDVIGLQECNYNWHVCLRKNLPDYDFVNADVPTAQPLEKAESLGKRDWMCTTMLYNTRTLELVDKELVGYSCNFWGCIQRMRYVSMARFRVKSSGKEFVFISTHLDAERSEGGRQMRRTQAQELAACIRRYRAAYGCPVISVADYNSIYDDQPITLLRGDAGMDACPANRAGIDYILCSEGVNVNYFTVVEDGDLEGASDHRPIFADLRL